MRRKLDVMLAQASIHEKQRAYLWPVVDPGLRQDDGLRIIKKIVLLGFALCIFITAFNAHAETLTITDKAGQYKASIEIEMALTQAQREKGLMHRKQLAPDTGMTFVFMPPQMVKMWMKDTFIPLDMLFADKDGRVFYIERNVQPLDLTPRGPDSNQTALVVELPAGTIDKKSIIIGDMLAISQKSR